MHEYEVRILRADRTIRTMYEFVHLNDRAAIREAEKLANGSSFEIWRGLDCIYATADRPPARPPDAKPPNARH